LELRDVSALVLGVGVVGLAELHDVHTMGAQRRTDRRGRVGGPGLDLELDEPCDLLLLRRHRLPDSSTGFRRRAVHTVGRLLVCTRPPALAPGADMRRHGRNLGEFTCNRCAILIRSQCPPRRPSDIEPARAAAERARRAGSARQSIFSTCVKPNSTGVSRPKSETSTLSFCAAESTSEILAGSVANGPSMTVTDSPTSNSTSTAGAAM